MIVHGFAGNDLQPPRTGASQRLLGLYRGLARHHAVSVLALVPNRHPGPDHEVVAGVRLRRHRAWYTSPAWRLERAGLLPMFALALPGHAVRARAIAGRLAGTPDARIADLALAGVLERGDGALRVLHCHNVEYDHFRSAGPRVLARGHWAARLRGLEARACANADVVVAGSEEDAARLAALYGVPGDRLLVVPNGYDETTLRPPTADERRRARAALGVPGGELIALFVGSDVPHNREGLRLLTEQVLPRCGSLGVTLLVVGGVSRVPAGAARFPAGGAHGGPRLILAPAMDDLLPLLHAADIGLNPVVGGGGSNVKLPTYLAAGLPVLTTPHGLRGYPELAGAVTVAERAGFADALAALRDQLVRRRDGTSAGPAPAGLAAYAWGALGERLGAALEQRRRAGGAQRAAAAAGAGPATAFAAGAPPA